MALTVSIKFATQRCLEDKNRSSWVSSHLCVKCICRVFCQKEFEAEVGRSPKYYFINELIKCNSENKQFTSITLGISVVSPSYVPVKGGGC